MSEGRTIMILGLGGVGAPLLEYLAISPEFDRIHDKIIGCNFNEDKGLRNVNNSRIVAYNRGVYPDIEFVRVNMEDKGEVAEILRTNEPDMVFHAATPMSGWITRLLPAEVATQLEEAGLGPLIPTQMGFLYNLMDGLRLAGLGRTTVVNVSAPDIAGPMLANRGFAYEVGVGNLGNYVSRLRHIASKRLNAHPRDIMLYWYIHHGAASLIGQRRCTGGAPYYLKIYLNQEDVTEQVDPGMRTMMTQDIGWPLMPKERATYNHVISMAAYRIIMGIWNDSGEIFYAPSPKGLPGGWTVKLSSAGADPVLPKGVGIDFLKQVNEEAARMKDGVAQIRSNGTLVLTDKSREIIAKTLGLNYEEVEVDHCLELGKEIVEAIKALAKKHGVTIPA